MTTTITLAQLARMVDGEPSGNPDLEISGFADLDSAGPGDLSFLASAGYLNRLAECRAGALLVGAGVEVEGRPLIRVADVYLAAAIIQNHFLARPFVAAGIHDSAVIGRDCEICEEVSIGPRVVLGDRVRLGRRVEIGAGAVLGAGVIVGDDCQIHPLVTIEPGCELGRRVIIHAGTVIGSDGYGYATTREGVHVKRPQLGIVRIGDDVEIGANCCVDRATFGVTWIKAGVKIDNLVQVGHNVVVGEHSLLVGQVGLSGSTILGRNVVFGGRAGTVGHQKIGDRTMVAGMSAVHGDQPAGSRLAGVPAIEAKQWFKAATAFARLPELLREIRTMKKELARLTGRIDGTRTEE